MFTVILLMFANSCTVVIACAASLDLYIFVFFVHFNVQNKVFCLFFGMANLFLNVSDTLIFLYSSSAFQLIAKIKIFKVTN